MRLRSLFLVSLAALAVCAVTGRVSWLARDTAIEHAYGTSANLARALDQHAARSVEAVNLSLTTITQLLALSDGTDAVLAPLIRNVLEGAPLVDAFGIYDAAGRRQPLSVGRETATIPATLSPGLLRIHAGPDGAPFRIDVDTTPGSDPAITISRRIQAPDGKFQGVIAARLRADYFQAFYASLDVGAGGAIALMRTDGLLMARYPAAKGLIGRSFANLTLIQEKLPISRTGSFEMVSNMDGIERIFSYRQLELYPLVVVIGLSWEQTLAEWTHRTQYLVLAMLAIVGLLAAIGWMHDRRLREQDRAANDLHRAFSEIEARRVILAGMLATIPDGVLALDPDQRVIALNQPLTRMLGLDAHLGSDFAPVGRALDEAVNDGLQRIGLDGLHQLAAEMLDSGVALLEHRLPDGTWIEFRVGDMVGGGMVVLLRDIDERKRREIELQESKSRLEDQADELRGTAEQLELASRLKTQFLTNMSHEVRTPLNGVLGMLGLLLQDVLTDEQRQMAETAYDSGKMLVSLIDNVLDLAKLEAGRVEIEHSPLLLSEVIERVVRLFGPLAQEKSLTIDYQLDPALPQRVMGDPIRLQQILTNMVANAVKFTLHGTILVSAIADGGDVIRFEVKDSGIGIAPETQPLLFQAFSQADGSITRRFGGSGLGLAIAKQLVELMGGAIGVDSLPGQGSRFWFSARLPVASARIAIAVVDKERPPQLAIGRHILLAEDNRANQLLASKLIERVGHRVDIVEDGAAAIAAVATTAYDLILMDVQMPSMDGLEATRRIRRLPGRGGHLPIIALTAHAMAGMREEFISAGMSDYVAKPIDPELFYQVLDHWLTRSIAAAAADLQDEAEPPAPFPLPPAGFFAGPSVGLPPGLRAELAQQAQAQDLDLDIGRLDDLAALLPAEELVGLIDRTLSSHADVLARMTLAADRGDSRAVADAAHEIAGSALGFGLAALAKLAQALERDLRSGVARDLTVMVLELNGIAERGADRLRKRFHPETLAVRAS